MPDKIPSSTQDAASSAKQPVGRWKASSAAGQDPATGAMIRRSAYGQTPQEAAERFADSLNKNHIQRENRAEGFKCP